VGFKEFRRSSCVFVTSALGRLSQYYRHKIVIFVVILLFLIIDYMVILNIESAYSL
jgi:hypothetical protein